MTSRYLRLLSNSGFMFSLYILIVGGGYFYQQWVKGLPETFPTEWILLLLFGFFIVRSPVRTLLRSADLVFLLPLEEKLEDYFKKAIRYSYIMQCIPLLFLWAIAMPLYLHTVDHRIGAYVLVLIVLFILKAWNLFCSWAETFVFASFKYKGLRGVFSFVFIYLLLAEAPWYFLVILIALALVLTLFVYNPLQRQHLMKWDVLLDIEMRQAANFDRFANLITDVPHMQNRIKPRNYLKAVTEIFAYSPKATFKKYFSKTFLRSGDYFGIYVRLLVIGGIVIWMAGGDLSSVIIAVVTVYLTAMQLLPLWNAGAIEGPGLLFPIPNKVRERNFLSVLMLLLVSEAIVLGIIALVVGISVIFALLTAGAGIVFAFLFTYGYASRKIRRSSLEL